MFVVEARSARAEIREQSEMDAIIDDLRADGGIPVIRAMREAAAAAAGMATTSPHVGQLLVDRGPMPERLGRSETAYGRRLVVGDMFFGDRHARIVQTMGPRLYLWCVRRHDTAPAIEELGRAVEQAARRRLDGRRVRGMDFTWEPVAEPIPSGSPRRFGVDTKLEAKPAVYDAETMTSAGIFADPARRDFLRRLAQIARTRSIDATVADTKLVEPLMKHGLVRSEVLIQCRKDNGHIAGAVGNRAAFDEISDRVFCSICSRPFRDEIVLDMYTLTDRAKELSGGSKWMTIWVTSQLVAAGVPLEKISWNAVAREDELDIFTDALGPRVFFELKDRTFGLGDAYPFASRVVRYGGIYGVVLTTEKATDEAKEYFKEQGASRFQVVEGTDEIARTLPLLIDRYSRRGVVQLIGDLSERMGITNLTPLAAGWLERVANVPRALAVPAVA